MRHSASGGGSTPATDIVNAITALGAGKPSVALARHDYAVPVTTAAYTQLIASLAAAVSQLFIFDSSGQTLVLAVGAPGSEVDKAYIIPGGNGELNLKIPLGSRVSIKAVSGDATVGEFNATFLG